MKNLLKNAGYKLLAVVMLLVLSQTAVWAEDGKTSGSSPALTGMQVVGGFVLLIAIILIPAFKSSRRVIAK